MEQRRLVLALIDAEPQRNPEWVQRAREGRLPARVEQVRA